MKKEDYNIFLDFVENKLRASKERVEKNHEVLTKARFKEDEYQVAEYLIKLGFSFPDKETFDRTCADQVKLKQEIEYLKSLQKILISKQADAEE